MGLTARRTRHEGVEERERLRGVELRGVGNLSIEQTGRESLTVEAEKAVIPKLTARVVDGRLIIGPKPNSATHTTKPRRASKPIGWRSP
jgi:hypothetical protein